MQRCMATFVECPAPAHRFLVSAGLCGVGVWDLGFEGFGLRDRGVQGLKFWGVGGLGFRVWGVWGIRVRGLGFLLVSGL